MRGLSARERILLSLVVAAVIGTLFYLFVWTPQTARRDELKTQLAQRQAELTRLEELARTREEKEREFQALSDRIRLVELKLPPEREIPRLIRQLQAAAAEIGVKMTLLRPGQTQQGQPIAPGGQTPPASPTAQTQAASPGRVQAAPAPQPQAPAGPQYNLFRLDLAFEGTYADLMAYLSRLEDFPRFIVLKQITMNPGELPRLRITIVAETYVLPREATAQ